MTKLQGAKKDKKNKKRKGPVDPKDIVEYASQIFETASKEIEFRAVVNRAYYGAFLKARDAAVILDESKSVHVNVINTYKKNNLNDISLNLDLLRKTRQHADYRLNRKIKYRHAKLSCKRAKLIIEALSSIS